jgi:hypothetical protein
MNPLTFHTTRIIGLIRLVWKYLQSITAFFVARESYLYRVLARDLRPQRVYLVI